MKAIFYSALLFFLIGCNNTRNDEVVNIGYNPIAYNLPYFVAAQNKFFEKEGLKVKAIKFSTSNAMAEALVAGDIDVATSASIVVMLGIEQAVQGKYKIFMTHVSTSTKPADFILIKNDSAIKNVKDLYGKKIGMHQGSTMKMYAKLSLKNFFEIDENTKFIQLSPANQINAFASNSIDALFAYEPVSSILIDKGIAKVLYPAPKNIILDPFPSGAYAVSTDFYQRNKDLSRKVIKAMENAVLYIRENSDTAKLAISEYAPIEKNIAEKINVIDYWLADEIDIDAVQEFSNILHEEGVLSESIDVRNLFINSER